MNRNIRLGLLMAAAAALAGQSFAQDASLEPQRTLVKYGDLNLKSAEGAQHLYRRIEAAARQVCPVVLRGLSPSQTHQKSCIQKAVRDAVASIGEPELTKLYQADTETTRFLAAESR